MIVYKTGGALLYGNITDIQDGFISLSCGHVALIDYNYSTTAKDPPQDMLIPLSRIDGLMWMSYPSTPATPRLP